MNGLLWTTRIKMIPTLIFFKIPHASFFLCIIAKIANKHLIVQFKNKNTNRKIEKYVEYVQS